MINFYVSGQELKYFSPVIAADSINYLTAKVHFTTPDWEGYAPWLHFRKGDTVYDLALDENHEITEARRLNLSEGEWEVYLTGTKGESRLTTVPVILTAKESGLLDAPLHGLPQSVAEQIDHKASHALDVALELERRAASGDFNTSFKPLGYFDSVEDLDDIIKPAAGDCYGVGDNYYVWDGINLEWVNIGPVQGVQGERGRQGVTFVPTVDANGIITWENDGGLNNPAARDLTGPKGDKGEKGNDGKSPYEAAKEGGYKGTETNFNQALVSLPYHNARHKPDGADPIIMQTGNYSDESVTAEKIANGAVSKVYEAEFKADKWSAVGSAYVQDALVAGLPDSDRIFGDVVFSEDLDTAFLENEEYGYVFSMTPSAGKLTAKAWYKPTVDLKVKLVVLHGDGLGTGGESGGSAVSTDSLTLVDRTTGTAYSLYFEDGLLHYDKG